MDLECIPCIIRQALGGTRLVTEDVAIQEQVLRQVLLLLSKIDWCQPPPAAIQAVQGELVSVVNQVDPYAQVKRDFTKLALSIYPELQSRVEQADDRFGAAVRIAIIGNVIDFGVNADLKVDTFLEAVQECFQADLDQVALNRFREAAARAQTILYLADNAGEIVFDRLLLGELKRLGRPAITVVVKGRPTLNDATMEDAKAAEITEQYPVIDNGSDAPGTILADCSPEFRRRFEMVDLVIAKGQANYETLSDAKQHIFFLLKAKCPIIARDIGCKVGDLVIKEHREDQSRG